MPTPVAETFCQEWFRRVWNTLEAGAIDALMTPDCVAHGLGSEPLRGPAGFRTLHDAFTSSFKDIRIDVLQEVHEGDLVAAYCSANVVTRAGERHLTFYGCPMIRLRGRQIAEAWNVWDFLTLAEGVGAVPAQSLHAAFSAAR
jgi:ketosteroid isomerase-like protein